MSQVIVGVERTMPGVPVGAIAILANYMDDELAFLPAHLHADLHAAGREVREWLNAQTLPEIDAPADAQTLTLQEQFDGLTEMFAKLVVQAGKLGLENDALRAELAKKEVR